jgi:hypothetical protein
MVLGQLCNHGTMVVPMSSLPHPAFLLFSNIGKGATNGHNMLPEPTQADLCELLQDIHDYAWQFDTQRLPRMLSSAGGIPSHELMDSVCEQLSSEALPAWSHLQGSDNVVWHPFINDYVNSL